jgi:hypothetical protein
MILIQAQVQGWSKGSLQYYNRVPSPCQERGIPATIDGAGARLGAALFVSKVGERIAPSGGDEALHLRG